MQQKHQQWLTGFHARVNWNKASGNFYLSFKEGEGGGTEKEGKHLPLSPPHQQHITSSDKSKNVLYNDRPYHAASYLAGVSNLWAPARFKTLLSYDAVFADISTKIQTQRETSELSRANLITSSFKQPLRRLLNIYFTTAQG